MAAALITVLMPFHNEEAHLQEWLESIRRQEFVNYELLAVDDHSSDRSVECINSWATEDNRIRLLQSSEKGLVAALNYGLQQAKASLIARMDADDIMHPDRIQ